MEKNKTTYRNYKTERFKESCYIHTYGGVSYKQRRDKKGRIDVRI